MLVSNILDKYLKYDKTRITSYNVCYTKLLRLDMLKVENVNVHCSDKRLGGINGTNHSMLRVKVDGQWYYCDPTYDTKKPMRYFMLTKDEISEIHQLSSYENKIVGDRNNFV